MKIALFLAVLPWCALAQTSPTPADLKAAYCIPVLQSGLASTDGLARSANLQRMTAYLKFRSASVDAASLIAPQLHADIDLSAVRMEAAACDRKCRGPQEDGSDYLSCRAQCQDTPARTRLEECNAVDWLPQ